MNDTYKKNHHQLYGGRTEMMQSDAHKLNLLSHKRSIMK